MTAPFQAPPQNGQPQLGQLTPQVKATIIDALGNAAQKSAEKGAMSQDGTQASAYGSAALSYVQAIVALIAPPKPAQAPGGQQNGSQSSQGGP